MLLQGRGLTEEDFRGERFRDHPSDVKGDPDLLNLTRPDIVTELHLEYLAAGADITTTNTFTATSVGQADYGLTDAVYDMNVEGARLAKLARRAARPRLGRRIDRPAQRHALHVAQGGRGVVPDDLVRSGVRGVRRADPRTARRGRRPPADRDDLRHAEREGRHRGGDGRGAGTPAMAVGDDHRPERTHAVRSDAGGVLGLDRARRADDRRGQLLARRHRDAPVRGGARARRADPGELLPERRSPERVRRLRRDARDHERTARRVRRSGAGEHRGRMLRHHAGAHPHDRRHGERRRPPPGADVRRSLHHA